MKRSSAVASVFAVLAFAVASVASAAPVITSGDGITVNAVTDVTARTFDISVTTPFVNANVVTKKGNGIRVTLPPDYETSGKDYPVVYFLHGADGDYQMLTSLLNVEARASGDAADVIIVTPDGGFGGFYTDWLNQSVAQKWESYHLTQVIPFIDRNLRTIASKEGRGIVGISMGGLGAMRYAVDRPDLFAAAASLSGAVDLTYGGVQLAVYSANSGHVNATGAFGLLGLSPTWGQVSPTNGTRARRLATVQTFIYAGSGSDLGESITTAASNNLHKVLSKVGVPHFFWNYGAPGATPYGTCSGGHTWECFNYSFADALPRLLDVLEGAY